MNVLGGGYDDCTNIISVYCCQGQHNSNYDSPQISCYFVYMTSYFIFLAFAQHELYPTMDFQCKTNLPFPLSPGVGTVFLAVCGAISALGTLAGSPRTPSSPVPLFSACKAQVRRLWSTTGPSPAKVGDHAGTPKRESTFSAMATKKMVRRRTLMSIAITLRGFALGGWS